MMHSKDIKSAILLIYMVDEIKEIEELLRRCSVILDDLEILKSGTIFPISKRYDIEEDMERIFLMVDGSFPSNLHGSLLYLLGELSDNINQHSRYTCGFIFMDYNKSTRAVCIIVFDDGISIPRGFEKEEILFLGDSEVNDVLYGLKPIVS